jgi:hypothetical protein
VRTRSVSDKAIVAGPNLNHGLSNELGGTSFEWIGMKFVQIGMSIDPFAKLKSDGDFLERHLADRIHELIPSYARIWTEFVGNDGGASALPMIGAGQEAEQSRSKHWQRLYTILESLGLCWHIEEELHRLQEVKTFNDYARNLNLWMAFYSHLGRIYDMIKDISGELGKPKMLTPFDEYWKERHIVLHGPKVPLKWVSNVLAAPPLSKNSRHWNDKMVWSDLCTDDFEFLSDGVTTILRELAIRLERFLAEMRKLLPVDCGWKPIVWPSVLDNPRPDYDLEAQASHGGIINLSGTGQILPAVWPDIAAMTPNISGSEQG